NETGWRSIEVDRGQVTYMQIRGPKLAPARNWTSIPVAILPFTHFTDQPLWLVTGNPDTHLFWGTRITRNSVSWFPSSTGDAYLNNEGGGWGFYYHADRRPGTATWIELQLPVFLRLTFVLPVIWLIRRVRRHLAIRKLRQHGLCPAC